MSPPSIYVHLPLVTPAANAIREAFDSYQREFKGITRRAKSRFEKMDGHGAQKDAVERLELYKKIVDQTVPRVAAILSGRSKNPEIWTRIKAEYSNLIVGSQDFELAETFFNSITRRIFTTVGVDPAREFVDSDFDPRLSANRSPAYRVYPASTKANKGRGPKQSLGVHSQYLLEEMLLRIYKDFRFAVSYREVNHDVCLAANLIHNRLSLVWGTPTCDRIEMLKPVFYRGNGAYIIGRICEKSGETRIVPIVFSLLNSPSGIFTDAVLLDEDDVSIVFSFTRSYFHVDADRPYDLVTFLKSIMPLKRIAELYISIGYNKHGKTELYRNLKEHLANTTDQFEIARGEKGMVMAVFTLPSYDMVFKVIKDKVLPPKTATRKEVMERYDLVFKHDRAGRLVDAQEFEHLSFEIQRFSQDLLSELLETAPSMVSVANDRVAIRHLYTERRLTPLNLYVQESGEQSARPVVVDYGAAIKDLAATNIFPGDILLKNFGVTRHGRVVFYDYDELTLLTQCKFRKIPTAHSFEDEFSSDPWFYVGPMDIFPEEFLTFLGLQEPLRSAFLREHEDLFDTAFWKNMQLKHQAGEIVDIFPYPPGKRLNPSDKSRLTRS
jgi:isocitrate dehydrogenase kinase/phosphatase